MIAILIMALFVTGLHVAGEDILAPIRKTLMRLFTYTKTITKSVEQDGVYKTVVTTEKKQYLIWKAVWGCPQCMSSIWGSAVFALGEGWWWTYTHPWIAWPISVIACAGLVAVLMRIYNFKK